MANEIPSPQPDDGGPVFPVILAGSTSVNGPGMSLRDYFAAHATESDVQALAYRIPIGQQIKPRSGGGADIVHDRPSNWRQIARYMHADAMLKARGGAA